MIPNVTTINGGQITTNTLDAQKLTIGQGNGITSNSRLKIFNDKIDIFEDSTLRVRLGNLTNNDDD